MKEVKKTMAHPAPNPWYQPLLDPYDALFGVPAQPSPRPKPFRPLKITKALDQIPAMPEGQILVVHILSPWYNLVYPDSPKINLRGGGAQLITATLVTEGNRSSEEFYHCVFGAREGAHLPQGHLLPLVQHPLVTSNIPWTDLSASHRLQNEMVAAVDLIARRYPNNWVIALLHQAYDEAYACEQIKSLLPQYPNLALLGIKHTIEPMILGGSRGWAHVDNIRAWRNVPFVVISDYELSVGASRAFNVVDRIYHGLPKVYFDYPFARQREGGWQMGTYSAQKRLGDGVQAAYYAGETLFESAGIANTPAHRIYIQQHVAPYLDGAHIHNVGEINLAGVLTRATSRRYMLHLNSPEPFNLSVAQGLSGGSLGIGYDEGATPEFYANGVNDWAFLVPPGDIQGIVDKIVFINSLNQRDLKKRAQRARNSMRQRFSGDAMVNNYHQLFRNLLAATARGQDLPPIR